jgi:hypothetical protein
MSGWFKRRYIARISVIIVLLVLVVSTVFYISSTQPPAPRGINCGTLDIPFDLTHFQKKSAIRSEGSCFWHAYQHCATATLTVHQIGIDNAIRSVFIVQQEQESCVLTDTMQEYSAEFQGLQFYHTSTCSSLTRSGNFLNFNGCGKQVGVSLPL